MTNLKQPHLQKPTVKFIDLGIDEAPSAHELDYVSKLLASIEAMEAHEVVSALDQMGIDLEVSSADAAALFYEDGTSSQSNQSSPLRTADDCELEATYFVGFAKCHSLDALVINNEYREFMWESWKAIDYLVDNEVNLCVHRHTSSISNAIAIPYYHIPSIGFGMSLDQTDVEASSFQKCIDKISTACRGQPCQVEPYVMKPTDCRLGEEIS